MPSKSTAHRGPTALHRYRGTGFEEFYADPPMTAAEAKEEQENIYHPDLPFVDRIQACIQRFRARRRLGASGELFNRYLFLGGIDSTPRMFGGNIDHDMQDMTPEEKRNATAIDVVHTSGGGSRFFNADDPDGWDVDFAGVVEGFCSENLPIITAWDYQHMGKTIGLLENFLTYILQHDVCPEYSDNVKEALRVCQKAKRDLPLTHQALLQFPGEFNLALSEMFCEDFYFFNGEVGFQRPDDFTPETVVKIAISMAGTQEQYDAVMNGLASKSIKVVNEEECSMEVVSIHRPDIASRELVRSICLDKGMPVAPVGTVVLKSCLIEDGYDYGHVELSEQTETLFLDDAILARLRPGFKLQLCVCELNVGIKFIRQARTVLVEWHTYLPQNLMHHFKEPVPSDRPAPSATISGAEKNAHGKAPGDL
ncbi:hypothetical protein EsH8_IX_000294 [Colletotrichum jinshuiense]